MKVFVIFKQHQGIWGKDAIVSFSGAEAVVHIQDKSQASAVCRQAAVKLSSLGFNTVELSGEGWSDEMQYAFWQGFYDAREKNSLTLAPHSSDVDDLIRVIRWVRETINMTPSELSPETFITRCETFLSSIAGKSHLSFNAYFGSELATHGFMGTYTVGKGSANEPSVLEVDYNPQESTTVDLCLVGKGITFDSGGYSLKPADYMTSMKSDMGGAATLAGVLALLIASRSDLHVKLYICAAENLVSGSAYKVDDIIHYPNGVSVEVSNTDAEGRLVMADGLIKSSEHNPALIIDAATLTGAAKVALTRDYNAALSFNEELSFGFKTAAEAVGEKAWPLPLSKDHRSGVKSSLADITNSASNERYGGASYAGAFLSYFVKDDIPWLHLDMSGSYQKTGNSEFQTGAKGHGVRSIVQFIQDYFKNK
ncbi:MAG: aminopeptidase PepB [Succinivibrionaceae bacterium]